MRGGYPQEHAETRNGDQDFAAPFLGHVGGSHDECRVKPTFACNMDVRECHQSFASATFGHLRPTPACLKHVEIEFMLRMSMFFPG